MRYKPFGPAGLELPAIGQGTWDVPVSGARLDEAKRAIRRGIELGMTHLDTAEMYGSGDVEEMLADAIAGLDRSKLFITSKVLPSNATYRGTLQAADRSLKRLKTDYVDLYLLHWPSEHAIEETMRALEELVMSGKSRYIGVSNFDADETIEAQSHLRSVPLTSNQVLYHLNERGIEHRLIAEAQKANIAIVAYTPFGRGRFPRGEAAAVLERIAQARNATVRQVILAFLTREPNVFTIPKASKVAHVEENAAAADLVLSAEEIASIDRAFPRGSASEPLATL